MNLFEHGLLNEPRGGSRTEVHTRPQMLDNPQFKSWFGDSKVCDQSGAPIVCFHGTFFEFTQFRHEDKGRGAAGNGFNRLGFWFDVDPGVPNWLAGHETGQQLETGMVYPCFLSIKNPLMIDSEALWDEDWEKLVEITDELAPLWNAYYKHQEKDGYFENEDRFLELRQQKAALLKTIQVERSDAFYRMMNLLPHGIKSSTQEVADFQAELIAEGYDGIWMGDTTADFGHREYKASDWWIAFHPNQIKSMHSKAFTDSDKINEQAGDA